jgi:hypothetical protein
VDRPRYDADPDPTFNFDTDPDPDPSPSITHLRKSEKCFDFCSQQCQLTLFYLSRQCHRCHNLSVLESILKFSGKFFVFSSVADPIPF